MKQRRSHSRPTVIPRVMVSVVLDNLAAGMAEDEVVRLYPSVSVNDVHAAVSYAAELARERLVTLAA